MELNLKVGIVLFFIYFIGVVLMLVGRKRTNTRNKWSTAITYLPILNIVIGIGLIADSFKNNK